MKKLHLLCFTILLSITSVAQHRYSDLKTKLLLPQTGDTVYTDSPLVIAVQIYNLGPDTVRYTDSIAETILVNGIPLLFYIDSVTILPYRPETGIQLSPGDSTIINLPVVIAPGWPTGATTFCVSALPYNAADSISDTVNTNDLSCATIIIKDQSVSIAKAKSPSLNTAEVYPNPAQSEVKLDISISTPGTVFIKLLDITGRVAMQEHQGYLPKGNHHLQINVSGLDQGLYFYHIIAGNDLISGKLLIR